MPRIAIVGVGAIGGVIAASLETTGLHEIILCSRSPLNRLRVETPSGSVVVNARNIALPKSAEPVDWVLVATKTYDTRNALVWLERLRRDATPVAILQNGVEHREPFEGYVDSHRILPVIIDCPAERREGNVILQRGALKMKVEDTWLGQAFAKLFGESDAKIEVTDDFLTAAWKKLCMNSAAAISALLMRPMGTLKGEALEQLILKIVAECAAVGRAEGARLDADIGQQILDAYRAQPSNAINSMLADRIAGRPMEIDSRNGVIVRKAKKYGIHTPINETVIALLRAMTDAECASRILHTTVLS